MDGLRKKGSYVTRFVSFCYTRLWWSFGKPFFAITKSFSYSEMTFICILLCAMKKRHENEAICIFLNRHGRAMHTAPQCSGGSTHTHLEPHTWLTSVTNIKTFISFQGFKQWRHTCAIESRQRFPLLAITRHDHQRYRLQSENAVNIPRAPGNKLLKSPRVLNHGRRSYLKNIKPSDKSIKQCKKIPNIKL